MRALLVHTAILLSLQVALGTRLQTASKKGIAGVVLRAGTDEPISGAEVIANWVIRPSGTRLPVPRSTTDSVGRFVISDIAPGSYRIFVRAEGYADQAYGARAGHIEDSEGSVVSVAEGQPRNDIVVRLTAGATIGGRVTALLTGEPLLGMQVHVFRETYDAFGRKVYAVEGVANTDDRGDYRIPRVAPGRYFLNAQVSPFFDSTLAGVFGRSTAASPGKFETTYYPRGEDLSRATSFDVSSGADLRGMNIAMARPPAFKVRGRVIDRDSGQAPAQGVQLSIVPRQGAGAQWFSESARPYQPDGTFELQDVLPGRYWLAAVAGPSLSASRSEELRQGAITLSPEEMGARALASITVSDSDVDSVTLSLAKNASLLGQVNVENRAFSDLPGFERVGIGIWHETIGGQLESPQFAEVKTDGTLAILNVFQGEYRVALQNLPTDVYIKEVRFGAVDALSSSIEIVSPVTKSLAITLGTNGGRVEGTVLNTASRPVPDIQAVLVPNEHRSRPDLYKTAVTDANGHFLITGVAPGNYKVFSWESLEPHGYFDPALLARSEMQGTPVHIDESSKATVSTSVVPSQR